MEISKKIIHKNSSMSDKNKNKYSIKYLDSL